MRCLKNPGFFHQQVVLPYQNKTHQIHLHVPKSIGLHWKRYKSNETSRERGKFQAKKSFLSPFYHKYPKKKQLVLVIMVLRVLWDHNSQRFINPKITRKILFYYSLIIWPNKNLVFEYKFVIARCRGNIGPVKLKLLKLFKFSWEIRTFRV